MNMSLGFTGTRHGMTPAQRECLAHWLPRYAGFHHGDCFGADEQAHQLAHRLGVPIVVHPPLTDRLRAFCRPAAVVHERKPYKERNHAIVDATSELLAAPDGPERLQSGTWATVRYARRRGKPVAIVYPDGSLELRR